MTRFHGWENLMDEVCRDLLYDLKHFEGHGYVVHNKKIGYKDADKIVENINYGYKTLFAYYLEHDRMLISKETLDE